MGTGAGLVPEQGQHPWGLGVRSALLQLEVLGEARAGAEMLVVVSARRVGW